MKTLRYILLISCVYFKINSRVTFLLFAHTDQIKLFPTFSLQNIEQIYKYIEKYSHFAISLNKSNNHRKLCTSGKCTKN